MSRIFCLFMLCLLCSCGSSRQDSEQTADSTSVLATDTTSSAEEYVQSEPSPQNEPYAETIDERGDAETGEDFAESEGGGEDMDPVDEYGRPVGMPVPTPVDGHFEFVGFSSDLKYCGLYTSSDDGEMTDFSYRVVDVDKNAYVNSRVYSSHKSWEDMAEDEVAPVRKEDSIADVEGAALFAKFKIERGAPTTHIKLDSMQLVNEITLGGLPYSLELSLRHDNEWVVGKLVLMQGPKGITLETMQATWEIANHRSPDFGYYPPVRMTDVFASGNKIAVLLSYDGPVYGTPAENNTIRYHVGRTVSTGIFK